jgi:hypothetical protein
MAVLAAILAWILVMPAVGSAVIADPVADAGVKSVAPDTNYGTKPTMYVQSLTDSYAHSFLMFDLDVPSGFYVASAVLNLYVRSNTYAANVSAFYVLDNTWTEDNITWTTASALPIGSLMDTESIPATTTGEYAVFNLLENGASLADGLLSVMLQLSTDPIQTRGLVTLATRNDTNPAYRPFLEYTLEAVPVPPTLLLFGSGLLGLAILRRRNG